MEKFKKSSKKISRMVKASDDDKITYYSPIFDRLPVRKFMTDSYWTVTRK